MLEGDLCKLRFDSYAKPGANKLFLVQSQLINVVGFTGHIINSTVLT